MSNSTSGGSGLDVLTITPDGLGKRTPTSQYPVKGRGGMGVTTIKPGHEVAAVLAVRPSDDVIIVTAHGQALRVRASTVKVSGRRTAGVILVRLASGDCVVGAVAVPGGDPE